MFVEEELVKSNTETCTVPLLVRVLVVPLKVKLLFPVVPDLNIPPDWTFAVRLALIVGTWLNCKVPPISNVMLSPVVVVTLFCMVTVTPGATHILLLFKK